MIAAGLATATGLPSAPGLAAGLLTATGDGLARAAGDGLALTIGLAIGAGRAIIAVGVATCGEPMGVGGLETLVAGDDPSEPLLQAAISTLTTANSTNR